MTKDKDTKKKKDFEGKYKRKTEFERNNQQGKRYDQEYVRHGKYRYDRQKSNNKAYVRWYSKR